MLPGETLGSGGPKSCEDCGQKFIPKVMFSGGGFYIGTDCQCGPNSRESGYYRTHEEAERDLKSMIYGRE